ncbi:MAG: alpha-L-fucosidase, partial [Anaerolineae bacterium]|nr:alpha-L-fucosidase [Gloeobacterales cyanobacterium ES-bin-313]
LGCLAGSAGAAPAPQPYGAIPTPTQLTWSEMEVYAFVHFTVNTFTGKEWGVGNEDPALFAPTDFSADQIVGTLAETGFKGVIFTAKHHDGFCLWPTKTTPHNITKSPWKKGRGDMVKEFAEASARYKVKFGVYLSPWDRHASTYGTPAYVDMYRAQLRELLTGYGPLFEVWHDNAQQRPVPKNPSFAPSPKLLICEASASTKRKCFSNPN